MTFPCLRHLNATQVRMSGEPHPEQVINFPLKEVRSRPKWRNRLDGWSILCEANLQPYAFLFGNGKKVVNDLEPRLRGIPIHTGDVGTVIKRASRIVT